MKRALQLRAGEVGDLAAIAAIVVAAWRDTFVGILPQEFLDGLSVEGQRARHARMIAAPGVVYQVALGAGGEVVGFASGGPSRQPALGAGCELYAIYLAPSARRQGTGRRLFGKVREELGVTGGAAFVALALAASPNLGFYRRLAGAPAGAPAIRLGNALVPQVAFFWPCAGAVSRF